MEIEKLSLQSTYVQELMSPLGFTTYFLYIQTTPHNHLNFFSRSCQTHAMLRLTKKFVRFPFDTELLQI